MDILYETVIEDGKQSFTAPQHIAAADCHQMPIRATSMPKVCPKLARANAARVAAGELKTSAKCSTSISSVYRQSRRATASTARAGTLLA
jgi:hypothetical protein